MVDRPHLLPPGYVLDILDLNVMLLRREDGEMVGAFSTAGSTLESIILSCSTGQARAGWIL
jgi:hypothetical protein